MRIIRGINLVGDGRRGLSHDLDCCVYLVDCGRRWVMIDSGCGLGNESVVSNIGEDGISMEEISHLIITHAHADHACGAAFFQDSFQLEVIAPEIESRLMQSGSDEELGIDMTRGSVYPPDFSYTHCKADIVVTHDEELRIGDKVFKFIQVPGHSPGITCVLVNRALFSSDVVFHGGTIGLGNWIGCDLAEYRRNIHRLAGLNVEQLFPGHFLFTLRSGQKHIDTAILNLQQPWVPPAWQHHHPHY